MAAAREPVTRSWAGMYVGGQVGGLMLNSVGDYNPDYDPPYDPAYSYGSRLSGSAGAYAGYNWQMGNIVAGIEVGAQVANLSAPYSSCTYVKHDWSAGVRGRLGVVTAGNTLLYGSVGVTAGHFDFSGYYGSGYSDAAFTGTGLQVGVGAEAFLTSRLSMRMETVYTQYGTHDIRSGGNPYWDVTPHVLEARFGLTYHLK
jgi:outer membrane immunogenic protein